MTSVPQLLVCGDPRDGVVRFAGELGGAVEALVGHRRQVPAPPPGGGRLHLHFTDRAWGATPGEAARRIVALAARTTLTVTLHDVPQPSDGARLPARVACYRELARAAAGLVCNSAHEVASLRELGVIEGDVPAVIPLPIIAPAAPTTAGPERREVALLGFVYPGKGHGEAIDAVASLGSAAGTAVTALGTASHGHEADLDALHRQARRRGVPFTVSGWLTESQLRTRCAAAAVPLAAHRHVSASGSIGSWIAAGRRPLVADSRYAREIDRLRPGTIRRYDPRDLAGALRGALADPAGTRLAAGTDTGPHLPDTARAYLDWWASR